MAMTAAETGHLVFGTLHTTGAVKTIDRIIDALPSDMKEQTKSFLSQSLKAVMTQTLIKTPEGRGRRACMEIMVMTRAIGNLIIQPADMQRGIEFARGIGGVKGVVIVQGDRMALWGEIELCQMSVQPISK